MLTPTCPKCGRAIDAADVNVGRDIAFCRPCNLTCELSALTRNTFLDPNVDLGNPPPGAWYRDNGMEKIIGASGRSASGAIGTFLIAAFWNGIVSIFVALAIASTLGHLGVRVPDWMPNPNSKDGGAMSVGMTIFLWVFLTPFLLIGFAMIGAFLGCIAGRLEIVVTDVKGILYRGIGPIGRRRQFNVADVNAVRIDEKQTRGKNGVSYTKTIVIDMTGGKPISFGSSLKDERRNFVAAALKAVLGKNSRR